MINATPFSALAVPMIDPASGADVVVAIVKASFHVAPGGVLTRPDELCPVRVNEVQHPASDEDAPDRSVRYPSDLCVRKIGTDVVLVGSAVSATPTATMDVALHVRDVTHSLRVHGPRLFYQGTFGLAVGPAAAVERVPLTYEHTYGGATADLSLLESKNPVGCGVAKRPADLIDKPAPQIERPDAPYKPGSRAEPAGWGAIPMHWSPRREYAGTYDDAWQRDRMPLFPADYDPRFASVAAPGLATAEPLAPSDTVIAVGVWERGAFQLSIPDLDLMVRGFRDSGQKESARPVLDTVLVEPDESRVELVYRWCFLMGRGPSLLREVRADVGDT